MHENVCDTIDYYTAPVAWAMASVQGEAVMVERDSGMNERLVARARAKASSRDTTLEAELVAWLERYVGTPDETPDGRRTDVVPSPSRRSSPPAASPSSRPERPRPEARSRAPASADGGSGSRTLAYRRLLVSMRDTSPRGEGEK